MSLEAEAFEEVEVYAEFRARLESLQHELRQKFGWCLEQNGYDDVMRLLQGSITGRLPLQCPMNIGDAPESDEARRANEEQASQTLANMWARQKIRAAKHGVDPWANTPRFV